MWTLYTMPKCGPCKSLKHHLERNEIPFKAVDITEDLGAQRMLAEKGVDRIPVLITDKGSMVVGFDKDVVNTLIQNYGRGNS